jgi:hypothetical protein
MLDTKKDRKNATFHYHMRVRSSYTRKFAQKNNNCNVCRNVGKSKHLRGFLRKQKLHDSLFWLHGLGFLLSSWQSFSCSRIFVVFYWTTSFSHFASFCVRFYVVFPAIMSSKGASFLPLLRLKLVNSVSTVSDYGLGDRGSIPDRQRTFSFSLCVQTGCGAHPASCTMGTGGKERPGRDADHSHHI